MASSSNIPVWLTTNAWREILARIFEGVETNMNVSPEWLVNPATNRRLKLDMLFPRLGVAIRLEGLQSQKRRQRPSLEEEVQEQARARARVEVCRAHGIELVVVDVTGDDPRATLQEIDISLSRAKTRLKNRALRQQINQARSTAAAIARQVRSLRDLKLYADLWQDRQYQIAEPAQTPQPDRPLPAFKAGMEVEHTRFGPGVIVAVSPSGNDTLLTVDFITAGQKTLAASLVADKLRVR